jgi:hypothetical protein
VEWVGWNPFIHFLIWASCTIVITARIARLAHETIEKPINAWLKKIESLPTSLGNSLKHHELPRIVYTLLSRQFHSFVPSSLIPSIKSSDLSAQIDPIVTALISTLLTSEFIVFFFLLILCGFFSSQ